MLDNIAKTTEFHITCIMRNLILHVPLKFCEKITVKSLPFYNLFTIIAIFITTIITIIIINDLHVSYSSGIIKL